MWGFRTAKMIPQLPRPDDTFMEPMTAHLIRLTPPGVPLQ